VECVGVGEVSASLASLFLLDLGGLDVSSEVIGVLGEWGLVFFLAWLTGFVLASAKFRGHGSTCPSCANHLFRASLSLSLFLKKGGGAHNHGH